MLDWLASSEPAALGLSRSPQLGPPIRDAFAAALPLSFTQNERFSLSATDLLWASSGTLSVLSGMVARV